MSGLLLLCTELTLFCTELTLFCSQLPEKCILNQSELSNFFMYIISAPIGLVITNRVREFCFSFD